jgi:hypothetical protein
MNHRLSLYHLSHCLYTSYVSANANMMTGLHVGIFFAAISRDLFPYFHNRIVVGSHLSLLLDSHTLLTLVWMIGFTYTLFLLLTLLWCCGGRFSVLIPNILYTNRLSDSLFPVSSYSSISGSVWYAVYGMCVIDDKLFLYTVPTVFLQATTTLL